MSHVGRMYWIGKITYYFGWIALVCGAMIHLHIATRFFTALSISKRNMFEVAVVSFLICIASELRVHVLPAEVLPADLRKAA